MALEIVEFAEVVVFRFGPVVTWDDLLALYGYYAKFDPLPEHLRPELVDLRLTWGSEIDYHKMAEYLKRFTLAPADFKVAIIATTPLTFGYARMFQTMIEPLVQQVEIFEAMTPALDWLAVSEATRKALLAD